MAKKILIADDEPDILKLVQFRLTQAGYAVVTAPDGVIAWELVQKEKPDLILLDYWMPGLNGEEVLKKIKADSSLKATPVIVMTAKTETDTIKRIVLMKATQRVIKPFDAEDLLDKIRTALE